MDKNIPFENGGFRDFYHRYILIECKEVMHELAESVEVMDDADGVLAYGFIEGNQGTTFALLNSVKIMEDGELKLGPSIYNEEDIPRLRYGDVEYYTFTPAEAFNIDLGMYSEIAEVIKENIETKDRLLNAIYNLEIIDGSRDPVAPDYVTVIINSELYPELMWARITGFGPDYIVGETLTASQMPDTNIEKNQTIAFRIMDFGDRISLIYDPEVKIDGVKN